MNPIKGNLLWIGLLGVLAFVFLAPAAIAQDFDMDCQPGVGPPCDDNPVSSLGLYKIWVLPPYRPMFIGYPGYNPATGVLTSPTLNDAATVVGRSAPHPLDADPPDLAGTPVGTAGTIISDLMFLVRPLGFEGPPGTREVHTEVVSLNMTDPLGSGTWVHAGAPAFGLPLSPGEVESLSWSDPPNPAQDFPAESFFDVVAEVFIPAGGAGWPGEVVYNPAVTPMVVHNNNLNRFPPKVVYIHGVTPAVPVLFTTNNPPTWVANSLFGFMVLAGHGMDYLYDNGSDMAEFEDIVNAAPLMPLPLVRCDGAESGGTGFVDATCAPGPRMYAYPVTDVNGSMTDLYIGTDDCNSANYSATCEPPGWTFAVERVQMPHDDGKTPHGAPSPGPTGNCPCRVHWSGPAGLPGAAFAFGFNNKQPSHDVGWTAVDSVSTYNAAWGLNLVGMGLGPVHGPAVVIPAVSQWGLVALTLLVLAAGTVVLRRHRALTG